MDDQGHLTNEERTAYWQRTLAPEALLALSDHLQVCVRCREELLGDINVRAKPEHGEAVSYEELVVWMDGDLDPLARRELAERISNSPRASAELVNLLRFCDEMNELHLRKNMPPPRPAVSFADRAGFCRSRPVSSSGLAFSG